MAMKKASLFLNNDRHFNRKSISVSEIDLAKAREVTRLTLADLVREGVDVERPGNRSQCPPYRPCPFVGCKYHLYLDVSRTGSLKFNFFELEPWEIPDTCSMDVADKSNEGLTLEEVGVLMGLTRERVRQIEYNAILKLRELKEYQ
jgi:hypothetical protein